MIGSHFIRSAAEAMQSGAIEQGSSEQVKPKTEVCVAYFRVPIQADAVNTGRRNAREDLL